MNKIQFTEQFGRLQNEWPRGYGQSKAEIFAREFGGHEHPFFVKVVDKLLMKFRYAPQATDVWSVIAEVQGEVFKKDKQFKHPEKNWSAESGLTRKEASRRWKLLHQFMTMRKEEQLANPDWLRSKIWPNETKEESERKYSQIMLEDAVKNKRRRA